MTSSYLEQIDRCIKDNWLSTVKGGYMEEFENEAAKLFGNKFGVSTCNGTSALYLALFCLSLESDKKEVIIPTYGFHVSISVICAFGLKPVFCDVDPATYALDVDKCDKLVNDNTLAIMVLQPWGNLTNLNKISQLQKKHKIFIISDSSHAHESRWRGKPIGEFFDINCVSFGLGKLISGGELGALTTDNPVFRDRALLFSHSNRVPSDLITNHYKHIPNNVGIKFRPHLFALLLALHDLKNNKNRRLTIKTNILNFQREVSSTTDQISFQLAYPEADRVFHMPVIELSVDINTKDLIEDLINSGFHAQKHNYETVLSKNKILTDFYHIKVKEEFANAESIIQKNIIQLYATDFLEVERVLILKEILLKHAGLSKTV
ncbi:MAG: aminotransferase class I/II-fold pyridoxal phosphate-dependent enzyme [Candidatus Shapirobacteria bacterium]|jgi:perosamine synthetase